jgi:DNA-directed RNA polymerase specialized sigma subunit
LYSKLELVLIQSFKCNDQIKKNAQQKQEVAKLLKVSTARVSQIKESALSKLREKLKDMV